MHDAYKRNHFKNALAHYMLSSKIWAGCSEPTCERHKLGNFPNIRLNETYSTIYAKFHKKLLRPVNPKK